MRTTKSKKKGLTDSELIEKYESGKINLKKRVERMFKVRTKSAKSTKKKGR